MLHVTSAFTFLFTDVESSTRLWEQAPTAMSGALARHDELVREAIAAHDGHCFKALGDAFCAAFGTPHAALAAALQGQQALARQNWKKFGPGLTEIRVRMAIHHGFAEAREGDYFGQALNRTARLMSAGRGGQILLSMAAQQVIRDYLPKNVSLLDRGEHELKDLHYKENIWQVVAPGMPQGEAGPLTEKSGWRNLSDRWASLFPSSGSEPNAVAPRRRATTRPPTPGAASPSQTPRKAPAKAAASTRANPSTAAKPVAKKPAPRTPATKAPTTGKPVAKKPAAKKPAAGKPVAKKPAAKAPAAGKPVAKKPAAKTPAADKATTKAPTAAKPAAQKPAAKKPAAQKPATNRSSAKRPAADKPATSKPATSKPAAQKPVAQKPAANRPSAKKPVADKPATSKPAPKKPAPKKPVGKKPVTKKPAADKPKTRKPGAKKPGAKKPGVKEPGAKKPSIKDAVEGLLGRLSG